MKDLIRANAGLLFAGIATFVMMGAGQSLYGPALPAFSRLFAVSLAEAGVLVSSHWVGCFLGVGFMYLRGAHVTPRHALAMMAVGAALIAALAGWWLTIAGAAVFGAGYGMATAVFNPRVLRAFGAFGPSMLSMLNATFGIGAIAAPLIFVALGSDPRWSFGLTAALAVAVWLFAGPAGRAQTAPEGQVRPFRPHWGIMAFGLVAIALEACLIGLGPSALIRAGIDEATAARLLSAFFVVFLLARVALMLVAHRIAAFVLFTGAIVVTALLALGAIHLSPAVFFVAIGAPAGLYFPGFYVTASGKMGEDLRVPPTIIASGLVGGIGGPLILAPLMERMGPLGFFWILAGVTLALSVAALMSQRHMRV
ncbi:MFS transporter [Tabrizicola thermarum]|uniref:MFS transporter n=1 Tax=Tabrizicola thermarum TaxID=2670345 RepID=UPI000FFB9C28|nr:MFS transporter [Tabrizicola thermarum]